MPDVSLEQRLALITQAFLQAYRAALAPTLPDDAALPIRTAFQDGERNCPCVVVDCENIQPHHNRRLQRAMVNVTLEVKTPDTTENDERAWARQLRRILSNKEKWGEFLASQDEADRTGYQIQRINVAAGPVSYDGDTERRYLPTTLTLFVVTDEFESTPT